MNRFKNPILRFISSVRLAVPLMLVLLVVCIAGTLIESKYTAEVASIWVYRAPWFLALLGLLWINILFAALSRIPFKKHHTGFVITHIGLLTLLLGSVVTSIWGLDGSLQVVEGGSSNRVFLNELALEAKVMGLSSKQKIRFSRKLSRVNFQDLKFVSPISELSVEAYEPFVEIQDGFKESSSIEDPAALKFKLKSKFFNVERWMDLGENSEIKMGPATFRITDLESYEKRSDRNSHKQNIKINKNKTNSNKPENDQPYLIVRKFKSSERSEKKSEIKKISTKNLKMGSTIKVKDVTVKVKSIFKNAVIDNKKIEEGGGDKLNPALEIQVERNGKLIREVVYAKFPTFSLNSEGIFGLSFSYSFPGLDESSGWTSGEHPSPVDGNLIEFIVSRSSTNTSEPDSVLVELSKNNKKVLSESKKVGQTLLTPWMGMEITIVKVFDHAQRAADVTPLGLPERSDLPPSALKLSVPQPQGQGQSVQSEWIAENTSKYLSVEDSGKIQRVNLFYGRDSVELPFAIHLKKFLKKDYPGSRTPKSFESYVKVRGDAQTHKVSMNEPMTKDGYTFYQSSYIVEPGRPAISIFSVNKDIGRWPKYIGSLILVFGILIFTLMRSTWYRNVQNKKTGAQGA